MKSSLDASRFYRNSLYQYYSCFTATLTFVVSGMHYSWTSPSLPALLAADSPVPVTESDGYWLANMPMFGAVAGSLSAPLLVDLLGRRRTIMLCSVPYILSWIMILFAGRIELMLAARFIAGISDGWGFSAVPIYIGEITEPKIRGLFGSSVSVAYILGMLLINIVGSYCTVSQTALISCCLPVALLVAAKTIPESPYFLIMKGNTAGAKENLRLLRGRFDVDEETARIQGNIEKDASIKTNPTALLTVPANRKAFLVLVLLKSTQELSGDSAIAFYTQSIFKEAGSDMPEQLAAIVFFSLELLVTAVASGAVDRIGRRPLLIFSVCSVSATLLAEGGYFYARNCTAWDVSGLTAVPLAALFAFVVCYSLGLKTIPMLMLGEVFQQDVKAVALCAGDLYAVLMVTSVTKVFQVTKDAYGMHVPFLFFGASCAALLVPVVLFVPETKGKTLQEIQNYFNSQTKTVRV
ncbi:unnamed protein product [Phyllotreta striolata]|uniref:Major facilitator superfamily (MFS) profile domain-containing protein n=1 Tax=Phyllotreta striolata TaxID=444603 RepID=A0A9N9TFU5_PHYSR|nr:unnamed protein product [Phyllotreta striolata]